MDRRWKIVRKADNVKKKQVNLYLDESLINSVKILAAIKNVSMSQIIENAVTAHYGEEIEKIQEIGKLTDKKWLEWLVPNNNPYLDGQPTSTAIWWRSGGGLYLRSGINTHPQSPQKEIAILLFCKTSVNLRYRRFRGKNVKLRFFQMSISQLFEQVTLFFSYNRFFQFGIRYASIYPFLYESICIRRLYSCSCSVCFFEATNS